MPLRGLIGLVGARSQPGCSKASWGGVATSPGLAFTLSAREFGGAVTPNYSAATLGALNVATFANLAMGARSATTNLTGRIDSGSTSAGSWSSGSASVSVTTAIRRATPDNPDGPYTALAFGIAPTDPDSVAMNTLDLDVDGVGGNDHRNVGVSTAVRFGRLRLQNALGSERIDLPIPAVLQHWNGTAFAFVTNMDDSCTTLTATNLSLGSYTGGITAINMGNSHITPATISFSVSPGVGDLKLTKPSPLPASPGSTTLTVDLGAEAKTYLQGNWGVATYTANPSSRAAFGLYGAQPRNFIFFRENY